MVTYADTAGIADAVAALTAQIRPAQTWASAQIIR